MKVVIYLFNYILSCNIKFSFFFLKKKGQREYVIATTQIVNGNSLLNSVMQKIDHLGHSSGGSS
jgi:hypothetical protein